MCWLVRIKNNHHVNNKCINEIELQLPMLSFTQFRNQQTRTFDHHNRIKGSPICNPNFDDTSIRGCHTTLEVGEWVLGDEGWGKRGANRIDSSGGRCDTPLCPSRRASFTCRCSPMLPMRSSCTWWSPPQIKEINSRWKRRPRGWKEWGKRWNMSDNSPSSEEDKLGFVFSDNWPSSIQGEGATPQFFEVGEGGKCLVTTPNEWMGDKLEPAAKAQLRDEPVGFEK